MKKLLYLAAAVALLFSFNACAPEDPAKAVNIEETCQYTAKITGVASVKVSSDAERMPYVTAGTVLTFVIQNSEYVTGAQGALLKTTTVGENGRFEIDVPVRNDGKGISVKITAGNFEMEIKEADKTEIYVFKLDGVSVADVIKDGEYSKSVVFEKADSMDETSGWKEATYEATLKYNNGKEEVNVPADTEVKITIAAADLVPERENDVVLVVKVGEGGKLTFKYPAPALATDPAGLSFEMSSAFIADFIEVKAGKDVATSYVYKLDGVSGTLYGGESNIETQEYTKGSSVGEVDQLATWKEATYVINYLYDNDDFAADNNYAQIPDDALITVTEKRSIIDSELADVVKTMTYAQFKGSEGYKTIAPDPALSDDALSIQIKINFIVEKKSDERDGTAVRDMFKYVESDGTSLRGGITKKGGADVNQPGGSTVKNAILFLNNEENLTNN